ncbi:hypothetical protein DFH06DRAFT_1193393 [Mycena polygramma]|nr:hypothetical protein DFH06DRAFT_1193393 [Mycena polygramma]
MGRISSNRMRAARTLRRRVRHSNNGSSSRDTSNRKTSAGRRDWGNILGPTSRRTSLRSTRARQARARILRRTSMRSTRAARAQGRILHLRKRISSSTILGRRILGKEGHRTSHRKRISSIRSTRAGLAPLRPRTLLRSRPALRLRIPGKRGRDTRRTARRLILRSSPLEGLGLGWGTALRCPPDRHHRCIRGRTPLLRVPLRAFLCDLMLRLGLRHRVTLPILLEALVGAVTRLLRHRTEGLRLVILRHSRRVRNLCTPHRQGILPVLRPGLRSRHLTRISTPRMDLRQLLIPAHRTILRSSCLLLIFRNPRSLPAQFRSTRRIIRRPMYNRRPISPFPGNRSLLPSKAVTPRAHHRLAVLRIRLPARRSPRRITFTNSRSSSPSPVQTIRLSPTCTITRLSSSSHRRGLPAAALLQCHTDREASHSRLMGSSRMAAPVSPPLRRRSRTRWGSR